MPELSPDELQRYARQLNVIGREGQERLHRSSVLCLGAGGLGSPAALYLAAAGVGRIGLIDDDEVTLSNLHRQLLHSTSDLHRPKVDSARDRLRDLNPHPELELHQLRFTAENARKLVANYDVIVDGSDNLATRYLSNDVCVWAGKPNVYGSVHQFEGQLSVFAPARGGPCYRCLFPEPPPPHAVPSCAEAGVIGVVPGILGTMQALEALKLLLGVGDPLIGRLLHLDGKAMHFREFKIRRDPDCPVCGDRPRITEPIDYEAFCGGSAREESVAAITASELRTRLQGESAPLLLDVREPYEFEIARLDGSELLPLSKLERNWQSLSRTRETVVICKSGIRSAHAIEFLQGEGFENLLNLSGGLDAWRREVDPSLPRY